MQNYSTIHYESSDMPVMECRLAIQYPQIIIPYKVRKIKHLKSRRQEIT